MTKLKMLRAEFEALSALCWEVGGLALRDALSERIEESVTKVDAALKAVEDEQRWIPVGDQKPEFTDMDDNDVEWCRVLALVDGEVREVVYSEAGWFGSFEIGKLNSEKVTHWRLLPEHPRKKGAQE